MRVKTEFEIRHFVAFTKLRGGKLEILASNPDHKVVEYQGSAYKVSHDAIQKVQLLNPSLKIINRIVQ